MSDSCTAQVLLWWYPPFFGETDADVLAKAVERCNKTCFQRLLSSTFPSMKRLKFLGRCDWATSTSILQTGKTCQIPKEVMVFPLQRCPALSCSHVAYSPIPVWETYLAAETVACRPLRSNFVDNMRRFQSQNKLKKAGSTREQLHRLIMQYMYVYVTYTLSVCHLGFFGTGSNVHYRWSLEPGSVSLWLLSSSSGFW